MNDRAKWDRVYYLKNRQRIREKSRINIQTQTDEERAKRTEAVRQWRLRNPELERKRGQQAAHLRRARLAEVTYEDTSEYEEILRGDPCVYCGQKNEEIDHIVALVNEGLHTWDNLTSSCGNCNRRKFTKDLLEFLLCTSRS